MKLQIEVVDDPAPLPGFALGWTALAAADAATPFQTCPWHLAWWELVGRHEPDAKPHFVMFYKSGRLCALAPLAIWQVEDGPVVRFSSDPWADYHDLLVDRAQVSPQAVYTALQEHLREGLAASRWTRVELLELPVWSPLTAFLTALPATAPTARMDPGTVCPRLDLADPASYQRATAKREYEVKQRRLERRGRLECRHHTHQGHIAERMPEFMAMHLRQWLGRPDCGLTFDRPDMIRFYEGCVPLLGAAGLLLLSELLLDGRPIAYYFGFLHRRTFWGYRTTYDTSLRKHSPGGVLHHLMFRHLWEQGYETFDFMRTDHPYKRRYASRICQNQKLIWQRAEPRQETRSAKNGPPQQNLWVSGGSGSRPRL